jgi:plastocyanin
VRSRILKMLVLLMTLALVGAACSSGGGGTMKIGSDTANDHGTQDVSGQSSTAVKQNNFFFDPTVLKGTPGQKITIDISNISKTLHNFTLQAQSIDQDVQPGQKMSVSVTFPQSGFLEFFCKYHRASGMVGELSA